jgi:hypothetical protein
MLFKNLIRYGREMRHSSAFPFISTTAFGSAVFLSRLIARGFTVCDWPVPRGATARIRFSSAATEVRI